MWATCASAMFVRPNGVTWLHGLAVWTATSVGLGVWAVRRGDLRAHRANMIGSYAGTLVAFGFATFVPTRAISRTWSSGPTVMLGTALAVGLAVAATCLAVIRRHGRPGRRSAAVLGRPAGVR